VNILKNNCAKSKKIAAVGYSVEAKIEEFDVRKQYADTTTLTSPQNTKNFVDVVPIKKTQVEKVARTILAIDTVTLRTETTNKFKNQNSLRSAPTTDFYKER
jgi:lipid II:glycine glycyltransferase (peptidoglycan interpeptide bridge formation enzyme)